MAKRKSKKRKGDAPKSGGQVSEKAQNKSAENPETQAEVKEASDNDEAVDKAGAEPEKSPARVSKTAQQKPDEEQGTEISDKGGLIVVAIIFGLIGLAIASQYLLN